MKRLLYFSFLTLCLFFSPAAFGQLDFLGMEEESSSDTVQKEEQTFEKTEVNKQDAQSEKTEAGDNTDTKAETNTAAAGTEEGMSETKEASADNNSEDFIDEYIADVETGKEAKSTARKILEQKPVILKLRQNQLKSLEEMEKSHNKKQPDTQKTPTPEKSAPTSADTQTSADTAQSLSESEKNRTETVNEAEAENEYRQLAKQLQPAPLGLFWGADRSEIQALGFELKPAERKDYKNVYLVLNGKQKNQTFRLISAIFGDNDKLWCIYAESNLLDDTPAAAKVLELYRKYYKALEKKYGNAQEYFTPYTDEKLLITGTSAQNANAKDEDPAEPVTHEIGNSNFLKELQEGKAVLYATFGDDTIGATLGVSVDGDFKSYIFLDYKNYELQKKELDAAFDSILNDL